MKLLEGCLSVILFTWGAYVVRGTCVAKGGGRMWQRGACMTIGGMYGEEGHAWQGWPAW